MLGTTVGSAGSQRGGRDCVDLLWGQELAAVFLENHSYAATAKMLRTPISCCE